MSTMQCLLQLQPQSSHHCQMEHQTVLGSFVKGRIREATKFPGTLVKLIFPDIERSTFKQVHVNVVVKNAGTQNSLNNGWIIHNGQIIDFFLNILKFSNWLI